MVEDGDITHLFLDEVSGYKMFNLVEVNTTTLWFVLPYHDVHLGKDTKKLYEKLLFTRIDLLQILRNCKRIAHYEGSKKYSTNMDVRMLSLSDKRELQISVPENVPEGITPVTIQDEDMDSNEKIRNAFHRMCKVTSKDNSILFLVRIDDSSILDHQKVFKTAVDAIESIGKSNGKTVKCYFNNPKLNKNFSASTETPLEFISEANSVLITDPESVEGFEWPNVIIYLKGDDRSAISLSETACRTNTSCFTRSTTNLILIDDNQPYRD